MTVHFLRILAVFLMFTSPLQAQSNDAPEGYESFDAYEVAMFEKIDALAIQKGIDVSRFHTFRDELRTEYAQAAQRNDKAGMAEANALRARLIRHSLEQVSQ